MGDQVLHVRLEVVPHGLGLNALLHEDQSIREGRVAEPLRLGYPFVDLLQVTLEDLRGESTDKGLRIRSIIGSRGFRDGSGVSVSGGG
jgi:hypothetical protein